MQIGSGYSSIMSSYYSTHSSQSKGAGKTGKSGGEEELFSKADTDGDGKVSSAEMSAFLAHMQSSRTQTADQSSSGSGAQAVNSTEQAETSQGFPAEELEQLFSESDEDGDGSLSLDEFAAFGENMRAQGAPPGVGPGGMGGPPPGPPPGESQQSGEADLLSSLTSNSASIMDLLNSEETDGAGMYAQLLSSLSGTDSSTDSSQFTSYMQKLLTQAYSAGAASVS